MDFLEEKYLKNLVLHLEDISKSLQIISGRTERSSVNEDKKETYKDRYFSKSEK